MAGRGMSSEDTKTVQMPTAFIGSMTVRLYCKCGDAVRVSGSPLYVEDSVMFFTEVHNTPGCEPCDSRTAARARAKRGRVGA